MKWQRIAAVGLVLLFTAGLVRADVHTISEGDLAVSFDTGTGAFSIVDEQTGPVISGGTLQVHVNGRVVFSDDKDAAFGVIVSEDRTSMSVRFDKAFDVRVRLIDDSEAVISVAGSIEGSAEFTGWAFCEMSDLLISAGNATQQIRVPALRRNGNRPLLGYLDGERRAATDVLVTTLGPASIPRARSVFDPERDLAIAATAGGEVNWRWAKAWKLTTQANAGEPLLALKLHRHYYRDTLGIDYYAPFRKRPDYETAPVVAMTWYGIRGWEGDPAQTKEWLYPNVDWVARHLLPYAGQIVFQLDDNYFTDRDDYMRDISDYIRRKGLVPGIWFTPFTVAPKSVYDKHPDWFIHDSAGKPIGTFGGVSYRDRYTLNVTNRGAIQNWYGMWWRKASDTWNFDFFKIDGQPPVISAYEKARDGGGIEGYRLGLKIARKIVGPDKFINGCWGIPLEAIGLVDGSRTGGDTGNYPHAIDIVLHWNFLNNVCWWSDPDAAANLYKATVERTRLNAQARVLTGQQFLTDDVWTEVPPAIARVWQLSCPMLDIHPANLYRIADDWKQHDLFDLRIAKEWGTYDVAGLFNYDGIAVEKNLDLSHLPLEAEEVHVYEYWEDGYLGRFEREEKIPVWLDEYEGKVFAIVPVTDERPQIVSTSRHVSQGGLDLEEVAWKRNGKGWIAHGRSSHLVAGDPYTLSIAAGPWRIASAESAAGDVEVARDDGLIKATITPSRDGAAGWRLEFEPVEKPVLAVFPETLEMGPESERRVSVSAFGEGAIQWKAESSDTRIRLSASQGQLDNGTAQIVVMADDTGLDRGTTWHGSIRISAEGAAGSPVEVPVILHVAPPENLALRATARASSQWNLNYKADRANDGVPSTRWNSRQGDVDGAWLELAWDETVAFDRVVIDECTDWGPRIQAWRLDAGDAEMQTIARGQTAGRNRTVDLDHTVRAARLRLTIEKASEVPTIWELKVLRMEQE